MKRRAPRVLISGLYSGPNPSPGVGVARSLRSAYPRARITGLDYSPRSTGLHVEELDRAWVARPWAELDLVEHARQIRDELGPDGVMIPGLDLEIEWLARDATLRRGVLAPAAASLRQVRKPPILPSELGIRTPAFVTFAEPEEVIHRFCRRHDWNVWVKGPYYEARLAHTWTDVLRAKEAVVSTWSSSDEAVFVQENIVGVETSVMLGAWRGRLVDAVLMTKLEITPEGKTWAGEISSLPKPLAAHLPGFIEQLGWHGGAEIEMIVDRSGGYWIVEWNPRFPAWVHGATLAGHNIPAQLVGLGTGESPREAIGRGDRFIRVVLEIPARPSPQMRLPYQDPNGSGLPGKHPSGMPSLSARLGVGRRSPSRRPRSAEAGPELDFDRLDGVAETPARLFLPAAAAANFDQAMTGAQIASSERTRVDVALSIKTDPRPELLRMAVDRGLLLEAISQAEVLAGLGAGAREEDLILNGPAKWWPKPVLARTVGALFFDSIPEGSGYVELPSWGQWAEDIGPRLRLPGTGSRFGIDLADLAAAKRMVALLRRLSRQHKLGMQFHLASSDVGLPRWSRLLDAMLAWSEFASRHAGPVRTLDLGGGHHPDDWHHILMDRLPVIVARASRQLPGLSRVIVEPGKALSQNTSVLVTRVLEVRRGRSATDVIVDAAIAELPRALAFPRRIWRLADGSTALLERGAGTVYGRLCMEDDVLGRHLDLAKLRPGDRLLISDAGAYDHTMSYDFGRG